MLKRATVSEDQTKYIGRENLGLHLLYQTKRCFYYVSIFLITKSNQSFIRFTSKWVVICFPTIHVVTLHHSTASHTKLVNEIFILNIDYFVSEISTVVSLPY